MINSGQSILHLVGTTAAIGMGVVFAALFLLSVYMHFFKLLIGRLEGRHRATQEPVLQRSASTAPKLDPVPAAATAVSVAAGDAQLAAAVAVGLRLHELAGVPGGEVAAAIAAALALHRGRGQAAPRSQRTTGPWPMAGRLEMMGARVRRQER